MNLIEKPIRWVERGGKGFQSSACGRFDLIYSVEGERWKCLDWERGQGMSGTLLECRIWCLRQLARNP